MNKLFDKQYNSLKVGDKVKILEIPGNGTKNYYLHADTLRVYKKIIKRNKPVTINEIAADGQAWYACRFKSKNGKFEKHFLNINKDDRNWIKC